MNKVQEVLVAWREAERQLHVATEPDDVERLSRVAAELHDAYLVEVDRVAAERGPTATGAQVEVS